MPHTSYKAHYYQAQSSLAHTLFKPITLFVYLIRTLYLRRGTKELWIDVGAGDGDFLRTVDAKRKIGVEISFAARKRMRSAQIHAITPNTFLREKTFHADVISFWHVLEHVNDPIQYLVASKNNLKQNGKLIIGVPNNNSIEFKIFKNRWFHLALKFHHWHFSISSLQKLLSSTGFKTDKIDYWSIEHHLTGILQSCINSTSSSPDILHKLVKRKTDHSLLRIQDLLSITFWLTLGLPFVLILWIFGSLLRRPGTFVVVASKR